MLKVILPIEEVSRLFLTKHYSFNDSINKLQKQPLQNVSMNTLRIRGAKFGNRWSRG